MVTQKNRPIGERHWGRSIGAMIGLAIGWSLMWSFGLGGLIYAFIFGVTGTIGGAMIGERWFPQDEAEK